jgi:NADPH2:quinone reductase
MARQTTFAPHRGPAHEATALPATMRAAAIDRFGGPEVVTIHTLPVPEINPRQVLIAVHTSGLAGWDADMRDGWSPTGHAPRFPFVLGTDGSGTVAAVGSRVRRLKVGDRVYASSFETAGFHAEYVAVVAEKVASVPPGLDLKDAGVIPINGVTALQGVDDTLHLKRDEAVIVHGGAGGVGSLAVQFAKLRGARVLATATGEDGVALVRRLGADAAVDGRRGDIVAAARHFAPDGIDAVLAFVGRDSLERCVDALRPGGRVAYPNGVEPEPKKRRGLEIIPYDGLAGVREFARLNRAIEAAKLRGVIAATFPLEEAARAHERLAQGHVLGKIVLRIG